MIRRGTTETCIFRFVNSDLTGANVYVTFSQGKGEIFTVLVDPSEMELDGADTVIAFNLTQEQTLKLRDGHSVKIQVRWIAADGVAMATKVVSDAVGKVLLEEVITYVD